MKNKIIAYAALIAIICNLWKAIELIMLTSMTTGEDIVKFVLHSSAVIVCIIVFEDYFKKVK